MPEKQQYLYRIQPVRSDMLTGEPTQEEQDITIQHFNYLKDLMDQGTVVLAGRTINTDPSSFGIVIFVAEDDNAAKQIMLNDPAIKNRIMRGEIFPYRMAIMAPNNIV